MVPKLTLDGGLLREADLRPSIRTLKKWESEGRIEIHESDRAIGNTSQGWPGGPPPTRPKSRFRATKKNESGGALFMRISGVLFPQRDPRRLYMHEINDVSHLLRHHSLGHMIFVTANMQNFILGGKREWLQSEFNIRVLTPEETVVVLEGVFNSETQKKPR